MRPGLTQRRQVIQGLASNGAWLGQAKRFSLGLMLILALDSAVAHCSATIVADGEVTAGFKQDVGRGPGSVLALMAQACLRSACVRASDLDLVAVTVGPGSFTGIRSGIALAQGIGAAAGRPVIGVTVGEALTDALPSLGGRTLWCATTSRRGRVFLEIGCQILSVALTDLPESPGPVAMAGAAAADVASRLAARGTDVMLTDARLPQGRHIALVAHRSWIGIIPPRAAEPLYIDPAQAKLPAVRPPAEPLS